MRIACSLTARLRGLLGSQALLEADEVLLLVPCNDIHTFGMRRAIDVAFIDEGGNVLQTSVGLPPGKRMRCRKAVAVAERYSQSGKWVGEVPAFAPKDESEWLRTGERVVLGTSCMEESKEGLGTMRGLWALRSPVMRVISRKSAMSKWVDQ